MSNFRFRLVAIPEWTGAVPRLSVLYPDIRLKTEEKSTETPAVKIPEKCRLG
jgi:hypothetical protein